MALPALRRLSHETGETALLTVLSPARDHAVCLERVETPQPLRLSVQPGRQLPLHAGASQKALLAFMRADEAERIVTSPLEHLCHATLTDPGLLRDELAKIRTRGWASSYEETNLGVWGVAVPVVNARDEAVCAIGIAGPSPRLTPGAGPRRRRARARRGDGAREGARPARAPGLGHPQRDHPGRQTLRHETEGKGNRMSEQRPLGGKVAIVTGAAKGIGGVVSDHLARDGADVALIGRDTAALEEHAGLLDEKYPERRSLAVTCDVTDEARGGRDGRRRSPRASVASTSWSTPPAGRGRSRRPPPSTRSRTSGRSWT